MQRTRTESVCSGYLEMKRCMQESYCNTPTAIILQDWDNFRHVLQMALCGNELWLCIIIDMTHCSANGCSCSKGVELPEMKKSIHNVHQTCRTFCSNYLSNYFKITLSPIACFSHGRFPFLMFSNACKNRRTTWGFQALSPHIMIWNDRYVLGQALHRAGIQLVAHLW